MIRITKRNIVFGIAGTIFEMHPYNNPENINKIMDAVNKWLDKKLDDNGDVDSCFKLFKYSNYDELYKELKSFLMNILEFRQLNISKKLFDAGVRDINDKRNQGIVFHSRYDIETKDSKYGDFIDLDACIRNIVNSIADKYEFNEDCFLCKYAKEYGSTNPSDCEKCNKCILNPKYRFNRECHPLSIKPKKDWTEEEKEKYSIS